MSKWDSIEDGVHVRHNDIEIPMDTRGRPHQMEFYKIRWMLVKNARNISFEYDTEAKARSKAATIRNMCKKNSWWLTVKKRGLKVIVEQKPRARRGFYEDWI